MQSLVPVLSKSFLLGLCLLTSQAFANGFYIGGSVGHAKVGLSDAERDINISDNDIGYKIYGGFKFTLVGVEGGYVNFGQIDGNDSEIEVSGLSAFGMVSMGLGPANVFGKLGGFVWESDFSSAQETYSEDGFDPALGLGAAFNLGGIGVRAEYEYFNISDFDDVSMFSVGATFWF